jgi:hypothetical protein
MKTRTVQDVRRDVETHSATIQPFNPRATAERFREAVVNPLLAQESRRDALARENAALAAQVASDRAALDARRAALEDRTIGLFSFQAVINCWARFLDARYAAARLDLVDAVDGVDALEAVVAAAERSAGALAARFGRADLDRLAARAADAGLALEALRRANAARRAGIPHRRAAAEARLAWLAQPPMALEHAPAVPIAAIDAGERAGLDAPLARGAHDRLKARQERLNELEIDARLAEEQFGAACGEEIERARAQAAKLLMLRDYFHSRTALEAAIAPAEERAARMRAQLSRVREADTPERRALFVNQAIVKRTQKCELEGQQFGDRIVELRHEARRKTRLFTQQRKALANGRNMYEKGEEARQAQELVVRTLERQVRELEFRLNLKLKEEQSLLGYVPPAEIFGDAGDTPLRIEETNTVLSIVAIASDRE